MSDAHSNFAYSLVRTPPSPGSSGLTLDILEGDSVLFPLPPFNAIVCPVDAAPLIGNAEIIRVTSAAEDTFDISRTQEGSNARDIHAGDAIFAGITAKAMADVEQIIPVGGIIMTGSDVTPGDPIPSGGAIWLPCDGGLYLTSDYNELAYKLVSKYGPGMSPGDGTHFNTPNFAQRFPLGKGTDGSKPGHTLGETGGALNHQHSIPGLSVPSLYIPSLNVNNHQHALSGAGHAKVGLSAVGGRFQIQGERLGNDIASSSAYWVLDGVTDSGTIGEGGIGTVSLGGKTDAGGATTVANGTGGGTTGGGTSGANDPAYLTANFIIRAL